VSPLDLCQAPRCERVINELGGLHRRKEGQKKKKKRKEKKRRDGVMKGTEKSEKGNKF